MKEYLPKFPLEFCALRFLLQWLQREKKLHDDISSNSPTENGIRNALAYFQVARNFKGLDEAKNIRLIIDALLEIRSNQSITHQEKVDSLADQLKGHFNKRPLSAASKLLWLSDRSPFIIYDSRAVKTLARTSQYKFSATKNTKYSSYSDAWCTEYKKFEELIRIAIQQLPKGRPFMPKCLLTDDELVLLAEEAWFRERVFDIFLWENGGEG